MSTAYRKPSTALAFLEQCGITVEPAVDLDDPGQCEWCGAPGALATVRIYGDPHPHSPVASPVDLAEVCTECAPVVIDRALAEQNETSRRDLVVEVPAAS